MGEAWQIPKNVRQVGEMNARVSIYIEDYVATLIQKVIENRENTATQAILIGNCHVKEDRTIYVIKGIVTDTKGIRQGEIFYTSEDLQKMIAEGAHYFPQIPVIGYAVFSTASFRLTSPDIARVVADLALESGGRDGRKLFSYIDSEEGVGYFSLAIGGVMEQVEGYYIYYEQNKEMQDYLIHWNLLHNNKLTEKQSTLLEMDTGDELWQNEKDTSHLFYGLACCALSFALAVGIVNMNNYAKIGKAQASLQETVTQAMVNLGLEDDVPMANLVQGTPQLVSPDGQDAASELAQTEGMQDSGLYDDLPIFRAGDTSAQTEAEQAKATGTPQSEETQENPTGTTLPAENQTEAAVSPQPGPESTENPADAAQTDTAQEAQAPVRREYLVASGDTLSSISRQFYGNASMVSEICAANGIGDADSIREGQKIILP